MIDEWQTTFSTRLQIDSSNKKTVHMYAIKMRTESRKAVSCARRDSDLTN
jgi:hypothetical protein